MRIALSVWQENISSVFDFAEKLLIIDMQNGTETGTELIDFTEQSCLEKTARLRQLKIDLLICGAISKQLAFMLTSAGIELLAFVTGQTGQVLDAYRNGNLNLPQFAMTAAPKGARRGFGREEDAAAKKN